jgi:tetratricopeptide (TPR) repeat protein
LTHFARDLYLPSVSDACLIRPNSPFFWRPPVVDSLEREIQGLRALLHTERDPQGRAFVPLADAYRRAHDLERALEVVSIGLERHPELASAYVVEAWVQQDRGDHNGAAAAWERVLELDPDNLEALRGLGKLLAAAGRTSRAEPLLERARELDPGRAGAVETNGAAGPSEEAVTTSGAEVVPEAAATADPDAIRDADATSESDASPRSGATSESHAREDELPAASDTGEVVEEELEETHELPATRTLAELYARQGLHERAAEVYERLSREHPDDAEVRRRLAELRSSGPALQPPAAPAGVHDEDTETLARELALPPTPVAPAETPFAWGPEEPPESLVADGSRTITSYFRELLSWSRARYAAAVPIESLAPIVVPIGALAPDETVSVESLAPAAVPIEMLAPGRGPAFPGPS